MTSRRKLFLFIALPIVIVALGVILLASRSDQSQTNNEQGGGATSDASLASNCDEIPLPVDISQVTAVLYPGQVRGDDYKPHGGLRFDDADSNAITVSAPLAATVTQGSRYIESDEVQYMFDFETSCGLNYRFDHLKTLSSKLQAAAETLPEPKIDDSRTTPIKNVAVTAGEVIATAVGFESSPSGLNVSFDFGVYSQKQRNSAASDPAWVAAHQEDGDQAIYAMCWLDLLSASDATRLKSLPTSTYTTTSNISDYCK